VLTQLRAEMAQRLRGAPQLPERDGERRRVPRSIAEHVARVRIGDLVLRGTIADVGSGGVFLMTQVVVEVGESGALTLLGPDEKRLCEDVGFRVAWTRSSMHPRGTGLGLAFEVHDPVNERRAIELVLAALSASPT
jgi:Tfp pilus assembly protein PilZ